MKYIKQIALAFFLFSLFSVVFAQEESSEMSPEMKAWMEYMTPGWAHEMMEKTEGEWNSETWYWQYPGAEAEKSAGTIKNEMIMGGRYLQSNHSGTTMGMPFEGMSLTGYDNITGKFTNIWIDNMSTGVSTSVGTYDKSTNSTEYHGTMMDPMTKSEVGYRAVAKTVDDDNQLFTMYMDYEGKEYKALEMKYFRK